MTKVLKEVLIEKDAIDGEKSDGIQIVNFEETQNPKDPVVTDTAQPEMVSALDVSSDVNDGDVDQYFIFEGENQDLTVTLINPYTGEVVEVDQETNVNTATYFGGGGDDTLFMTNLGDALFLTDSLGNQVFGDIETIVAGDGSDIIILSSDNIEIGDVTILGGQGDDIIWSNVGDDVINGYNGDDIINAGPGQDQVAGGNDNDNIRGADGDDRLYGDAGDDTLYGDMGADTLYGGTGNDTLYGGLNNPGAVKVADKDFIDDIIFPDLVEGTDIKNLRPPGNPALGINEGNLTIDHSAQATITFREGFAGYNNTLGVYRIAEDGTIEAAQVLWENVKDAGIDAPHTIDLPVGEDGGEFGFFIIANGDRMNHEYHDIDITGNGVMRFVYDHGGPNERAANIHDSGRDVSMVYDDGTTVKVLNGQHYHTSDRGGDDSINWDGKTHVVSGLVEEGNSDVLRIGFEDLPQLGDADFEDVLFDLDVIETTTSLEDFGNDTLVGGGGDDLLYGEGGDDILFIGNGADHAYGGQGNDLFVFDVLDSRVDTIHDFSDGDALNITNILSGYDPLADALSDFVQLVDQGDNVSVMINVDGQGTDFVELITLVNTDVTLSDLIDNNQIVADQHVIL